MKIAYLIRARPDLDDRIPDDVEAVQAQVGESGVYSSEALERVREAEGFIVAMEPVNEQIISAAPRLRIVQRLGVGYETLDLEATAKRGIPACNLEGVNREAVAEHAMMFMLAHARRFLEAQALTQGADWESARLLTTRTFELKGKTLGIIGFGNTGSALARRAHAFEMRLLYHDIRDVNVRLAARLDAGKVDLDRLLRESDIVSVCTDLNDTSRGMIDAAALARMRSSALLVCCARGGIVDEAALAAALRGGGIAGAAIDVFEVEPIPSGHPLIGLPNCLLTSHVAGVAGDTVDRIWEWAHENVRAVVQRGERPRFVLNGV